MGNKCTLFQGDCLSILPTLPDKSVDLLLTDPPYGTTNLPFDKAKIDWKTWWGEVNRVCKPSAVQVCFAALPFAMDLISSNRRNYRYDLVWAKTYSVGFLSANVRPLRAHELMLVFCQKFGRSEGKMQSVYNPQFEVGTPYKAKRRGTRCAHYGKPKHDSITENHGRRYPISVQTHGRDVKAFHPTQKPIALLEWLVRTYSNPGDVVLDPFMGGGSAGVASVGLGRQFVGIEMDERYFEVAKGRIEEM